MAGCVREEDPADAKDEFESWMFFINRRPICLLKCAFPGGPEWGNAKRVVVRTSRASREKAGQAKQVWRKINPGQMARWGLEGPELGLFSVTEAHGDTREHHTKHPRCSRNPLPADLLLPHNFSPLSDCFLPGSSVEVVSSPRGHFEDTGALGKG